MNNRADFCCLRKLACFAGGFKQRVATSSNIQFKLQPATKQLKKESFQTHPAPELDKGLLKSIARERKAESNSFLTYDGRLHLISLIYKSIHY